MCLAPTLPAKPAQHSTTAMSRHCRIIPYSGQPEPDAAAEITRQPSVFSAWVLAGDLVLEVWSRFLASRKSVNDRTYAVTHSNAFSLRQHGTSHYICGSFFARAKNEPQKEDTVPRGWFSEYVSPVCKAARPAAPAHRRRARTQSRRLVRPTQAQTRLEPARRRCPGRVTQMAGSAHRSA